LITTTMTFSHLEVKRLVYKTVFPLDVLFEATGNLRRKAKDLQKEENAEQKESYTSESAKLKKRP